MPQSWFAHFYMVGVASNLATLALMWRILAAEHLEISAREAASCLALCLLQLHLTRRLLESLLLFDYPKDSRMHLIAYLFGLRQVTPSNACLCSRCLHLTQHSYHSLQRRDKPSSMRSTRGSTKIRLWEVALLDPRDTICTKSTTLPLVRLEGYWAQLLRCAAAVPSTWQLLEAHGSADGIGGSEKALGRCTIAGGRARLGGHTAGIGACADAGESCQSSKRPLQCSWQVLVFLFQCPYLLFWTILDHQVDPISQGVCPH